MTREKKGKNREAGREARNEAKRSRGKGADKGPSDRFGAEEESREKSI